MEQAQRLGFIGVGTMGGRMCRNLATRSGLPVTAFDVSASNVEALADAGVTASASVAALTAAVDIIFMCLPGEPQIREVGFGPQGLVANVRAGQIVVDMTTATVGVEKELADALAAKGVEFADAPVAKGVPSAGDGTLSITVGASAALFSKIEPLLKTMGTEISHCGDIGTGQVVKLMNNMMVFQTVSALSEAMAIGTRAGVDRSKLFEFLSHGSADSFVLRRHGSWMTKGEYPDDLFPTTYSQKDLGYALALAEDVGVDAKGAKVVMERFAEAIEKGYGSMYSPVIYKLLEDE
ncbi:MAG: 3-hydroxyisobutyrate dehydrogenase-like beta-hydroxyacid dehydrogenase [Gammaproteobacteria bacterium]|jgi:3-hydroxyisobutyrate dehydrogenase-like beta-hydroxyacid dehydrogenase